jgi:D-alanyl-D-alanine carboxypeptidase/D-alanyl-D-alanine-endopeptidase (penicillin-binding protein 4)
MPPRLALALLAVLCLANPLAAQTPTLTTQIAAITTEPAVSRAHWGVMVTAMDGTPIVALNEGQLFQPASNTKLFTTAAALALLQGGSRFETRVIAQSAPAAGTLHGDLILVGDGDANLSGRAIPYAEPPAKQFPLPPLHILDEIAGTIAATGLTRIDGDIVGDDTLFPWEPYAPDWAADDLLWGYGAPVSALTVNDNQLKLTIRPGRFPPDYGTHRAEGPIPPLIATDPATPFYTIQNDAVTTDPKSRTSIGIERQAGSRVLRVFGTIAGDAPPETYEIAIDDPAEFAALSLKASLESRGITITGKAVARHQSRTSTSGFLEQARLPIADLGAGSGGTIAPCLRCNNLSGSYSGDPVLARIHSPTVAEDVVVTNKESQNLHAELLLHQLAAAFADDGSTAQGARVVRQFLVNSANRSANNSSANNSANSSSANSGAGIDPADFVFYDGSGMSGHDLVTPRAVAKLLRFAATQPWFAVYKASLPVGGIDGTLENRFTRPPLKGRVFAKTGTNSESRALSGYLECASGRTVIFSILVGNHAPGSAADRDAMDRIVAAIAAAN